MGENGRDQSVDDITEQEVDRLGGEVKRQLYDALPEYLAEAKHSGDRAEMRVRSLSPVISFFSIHRQERLLAAMKKQSEAMTWHSWLMVGMTAAILLATLTQVVLLVLRK